MEEGGPPPSGSGGGAAGGGPAAWTTGVTSFDAAAFFEQQQRQQEEQRAAQGAQLQAAADMLLPSSSEEESSEGEGSEPEAERPAAAAGGGERRERRERRRRSRSRSTSSEGRRRHRSKRRRKEKEKEKERKRRREKDKGRERRRESEREQQVRLERQTGASQRAAQVKAWAGAEGPGRDPFYFDTRGDPANVAFEGLYRGDVARYRRHDPAAFAASLGAQRRGPGMYGVRVLPTEADGHWQRDGARRYFGPASLRAERNSRLKRWRRALQQQEGAEPAAPAGSLAPGGGAALGLLALRKAPGQQGRRAERAAARGLELPSPNFLPLQPEEPAGGPAQPHLQQQGVPLPQPGSAAAELAAEQAAARAAGESNEEMLLRRTREFNAAARERPHDVQLWLQFARFQDEALRLGPAQRGAARGAAEKKIAILEKALSLHPGSDELLLALLQAAEAVCDERELEQRWRAVLARHGGSPRLWRAYLRHRRTQFSAFNAGEVAEAYSEAFAALHREHRRRAAQGAPRSALDPLESEAAAVALEGAALRLAAGGTEAGVAALAVLLEFNFFAPEGWPQDALELMFEEFWRSSSPLVGHAPGAAGWGAWIAGSEPAGAAAAAAAAPGSAARERRAAAEAAEVAEARGPQQAAGGQAQQAQQAQQPASEWSGWEELAPVIRARFGHSLRFDEAPAAEGGAAAAAAAAGDGGEGSAGSEAEEEEEAEEPAVEEETDEQLLERLGLDLEAALEEAAQELTPPLLHAWLAEERARQGAQWLPRRAEAPPPAASSVDSQDEGPEAEGAAEEEEAAHRTVAWRDVRRLLWRFDSEPARQQLLAGCLRLLGAPLPGALPSNSPAAAAAAGGADELWWAAAAAGCHPGRTAADGSGQHASSWVGKLLAQGDWAWLLGGAGSQQPPGLRQRPWCRDGDPLRRAMLQHTLEALLRGPCRTDASLAAALLETAFDAGPSESFGAANEVAPRVAMDSSRARQLAKQLLAEQRTNLALWQAYAQLESANGSGKAARKVYQTCFTTVGAPVGLAAAASVAALVLGAVLLELEGIGGAASSSWLPSAADAAPAWPASSLLPALTDGGGAAPNQALAAARQLAWLGSGGGVALPAAAAQPQPLQQQELVAAKRGFQDLLLALVRQQQQQQQQQGGLGGSAASAASSRGGGLGAGGAALVTAAAAFEQLAGHLRRDLSGGVKAALAIYDQVLAAVAPAGDINTLAGAQAGSAGGPVDAHLELLTWQRCRLAADAAQRALPCCPPAVAREGLLRALAAFPASPALLQLLVAHEVGGHTLAALRRGLHAVLDLHPSPQAWLAMVALEVATRSPSAAVQAALERAVSSEAGRHCPVLWRCYLRFEAARGRHEAVRRLFLRAIGACPWAKAVWCDGLALLNGRVPPKELAEYLEAMKDKGLVVRTDVLEVVLQQMELAGAGAAAAADS